jgi:hypothetical protein
MKKITTPFAFALGLSATTLVVPTASNAQSDLFGATLLSSGYLQLAANEMACGAAMKMDEKQKMPEGACAAIHGKDASKSVEAENTKKDEPNADKNTHSQH